MEAERLFFSQFPESNLKLEGEFLGFSRNSESERKYLLVSLADREIKLKLAKELRHIITENWIQGDRLQVFVKMKKKGKHDAPKLQAYHIDRLSCTLHASKDFGRSICQQSAKSNVGKIAICQKSGCLKRGGKTLYQEIERALSALGLQDRVKIETTGCQKRCKKAPNMVLMPGNRHCSQISSNAIYHLLKEHYNQ